MAKHLNENRLAEEEANDVAARFMNSSDVMADMEQAYHTSFANVTIHTDEEADDRVKAAGRDAIASGSDIFFGKGILESHSPESKGLMAHELTHVMQQSGDASALGLNESVSYGEEEGGLLSWIRGLWNRRKKKQVLDSGMMNLTQRGMISSTPSLNSSDFKGNDLTDVFTKYQNKYDNLMNDGFIGDMDNAVDNREGRSGHNVEKELLDNNQSNINEYYSNLAASNYDFNHAYDGVTMGQGIEDSNNFDTTQMTMNLMDIFKNNANSGVGENYFKTMDAHIKTHDMFNKKRRPDNQTLLGRSFKATPVDFILHQYITRQREGLKNTEIPGVDNKSQLMNKISSNLKYVSDIVLNKKITGKKLETDDSNLIKMIKKYEELTKEIQKVIDRPGIQ